MMSTRRNTYSTPRTPRSTGGGGAGAAVGPSSLVDKVDKNRLLTDRAAYLNFLEVQLERVSSSCLTVQAFSERIEQVQTQVNAMEEKVLNCGRLIKLMQQYNEEVNRVAENIKVRVNEMNEDIEGRTNEKLEVLGSEVQKQFLESAQSVDAARDSADEACAALRSDMERSVAAMEKVASEHKMMEKQLAEQYDMIKASEKLCNRLADDAVGSIEANDRKATDFFQDFREHIAAQFNDVHDRISRQREDATQHVMEMVEKRLNAHFSEQLGKMSEVLKKVVTNQRTLQQKVAAVEGSVEVIGYQVDKKPVTRGVTSRATSVSPKRRAVSPQSMLRASPTFGAARSPPLVSPGEVDAAFQMQPSASVADSQAADTAGAGNTLVPSTQMPKLEHAAASPNSFSPWRDGKFQTGASSSSAQNTGNFSPENNGVSREDILNFDIPVTIPGVGSLATRGNYRARAGSGQSDRRSVSSPSGAGAARKRGTTLGPRGSGVRTGGSASKLSNRIQRRQAMEDLYRELRRLQSEDMMDDS
ncbi:unnamed protein product [Amoebophrya sp. A120]|nr:unnamed protein product [Amoebophrya sp. A120]|eukprot:GSA120T00002388001.1